MYEQDKLWTNYGTSKSIQIYTLSININQNKPYGDFLTAADSICEFNVLKPCTSKPKCIDVPVMFDLNI